MTRFSEKIIEHTMCGLICLQLLSKTFLILRKTERDMIMNVYWPSCKVSVILVIFQFFRQVFKKSSNIKFHGKLSNGSRVVPSGRTDKQADRQTWRS